MFWGALGGWLAVQLLLACYAGATGPPHNWAHLHSWSLIFGGLGACVGAACASGSTRISAGCMLYLALWVVLASLAVEAFDQMGVWRLAWVSAFAGFLLGFWLLGDGPLSPLFLLFLLLWSWLYGVWGLIVPPPVLSLRNLGLTLGGLLLFLLAHASAARLLRGRQPLRRGGDEG